MNPAERDKIQEQWEEMSNESIVKDVATKGKYINLAISYLMQRLDVSTVQEAKAFFRTEVNKYVERLLSNKQVFKAEHVLTNANISPTYFFCEFYENCGDSDVRSAIINYLKKTLGDDYEHKHLQMSIELKALKLISSDETLSEKYGNCTTLEDFKELDEKVRKELLTDACFTFKCELIVDELDKHVTWKYLLDHQLFVPLYRWIESIGNDLMENMIGLDVNFENILKKKFTAWDIDTDMIDQIHMHEGLLPDYILNCLAKRSIFMKNEVANIDLLIQRIFSSESLNVNNEMLSSRPHSMEIVKSILNRNLNQFLIEDFIKLDDLIEVAPLYPQHRDEIELCITLKQTLPDDLSTISKEVTEYLTKKDPKFRQDNHIVNFVDLMLHETSDAVPPSPDDFNDIPMLKSILQKFQSSDGLNDFQVTLQELVKRFRRVDLNSIKSDAGDEDLNFRNASLFEVCLIFRRRSVHVEDG